MTKAEARREYKRKWRERNREHLREYDRKWREAHPDKLKEYKERFYGKYAESVESGER